MSQKRQTTNQTPGKRPCSFVAITFLLASWLVSPSLAHGAFEVRSAKLMDGAHLALRLDACATPGPLVQVREAGGEVRFSLDAIALELSCSEHVTLPTASAPGEGSWVQDWWVDQQRGVLVVVDRETRAPRVLSLLDGARLPLYPSVVSARLRDQALWPREQLRALDLAAAWTPLHSLKAIHGVVHDADRPPVVRLRGAALLRAFGDDSGIPYVLDMTAPPPTLSGMRPRSDLTFADLGGLASRTGGGVLCDRPPPAGHERPHDADAARQYAIQLLPTVLGFSSVPRLRALVQRGDPLDRVAVRSALMCLSLRLPDDDPRAASIEAAAQWTGGGATLMTEAPSLRELEASAGSPDRYVAAQALRSLLARDDGTESALRRLLVRGTPHDGLVALYFATHPSVHAVQPLVDALHRHPDKSRAAELLVMALRASVPDDERDTLVATNGASPSRWKAWAADRTQRRRARVDPLTLLASLLPLLALMFVTRPGRDES